MQKFISKIYLLVLFLLPTFLFNAQANNNPPILTLGTATVDDDGGGPIILHDLVDCDIKLTFRVVLSRLLYFDPEPVFNNETEEITEFFPEGTEHPDMYLQYYVEDGPIIRIPLTEFIYNEELEISEVIIETYTVNLSNQCARIPENEDSFILDYEAKLVTKEEDNFGNVIYKPYPICDYIAQDDIFAHLNPAFGIVGSTNTVSSFANNGDIEKPAIRPIYDDSPTSRTDDGGINCEDGLSSIWNIHIFCDGCIFGETPSEQGGDQGTGLTEVNSRNKIDQFESIPAEFSAYPNPFNDNLKVEWSAEQTLESLELYDIHGNTISNWTKDQLIDKTALNVNTDLIAKGLYFVKANYTNTTKVIKILKQ